MGGSQVPKEAIRLYSTQRLRDRLVALNDGQVNGYIRNAMKMLGQTPYFPIPTKNYVEKILAGSVPCPRKLAANLIRVAEQEDLAMREVPPLIDRYFETREAE
jgi:hypothetical protein